MDNLDQRTQETLTAVGAFVDSLVNYLPNLFGAIVLIAVGWVLGRLLKRSVVNLGDRLTRMLSRLFAGTRLENVRLTEVSTRISGDVLFVVVLLVFIAAAVRVAEIPAFSAWLDRVVTYLPQFVAGIFIIIVGILAGLLARDLSAAGLDAAEIPRSRTIAKIVQVAIVSVAIVMALDQVGVDATLLVILFGITSGGAAFGVALAFGLGSRRHVENLLAAQNVRRQFRVGQRLRIGEHVGTIVELTPTTAALQTDDGRVFIPARLFDADAATLLPEAEDDD
jgi:small-conductance mechanosensitive channel